MLYLTRHFIHKMPPFQPGALATFPGLSSHVWLAAATLPGTATDRTTGRWPGATRQGKQLSQALSLRRPTQHCRVTGPEQ